MESPLRAIDRDGGIGLMGKRGGISEDLMAKVLGVGGVFFKSKDPKALLQWYKDVVGLELQPWGGVVLRPQAMVDHPGAATVFAPFKQDTTYFAPSTKDFMINLAVDDLDGVLASCASHGVTATVMEDQPNGRFAHIMDPEGTRIELWQPKPMS